jgi:hypothetical protein
MVVYLFSEQVNAKDEAKRQQYRKWVVEEWQPYVTELQEKGFGKGIGWTDGTGTMYGLWEFEDMDAFAKLWNDEKFHRLTITRNELVDKLKIKLCRPSIVVPPKK